MFRLDDRLAADTVPIRNLPLCHVLLMDNRAWPWLILVPARDGIREVHRLNAADRARLMEEIAVVSEVMETMFQPDKLNVAALGNIVNQLHVHIVARKVGDPAWPGPVWGSGHGDRYDAEERDGLMARLGDALRKSMDDGRSDGVGRTADTPD